jgi:hypothetical protein
LRFNPLKGALRVVVASERLVISGIPGRNTLDRDCRAEHVYWSVLAFWGLRGDGPASYGPVPGLRAELWGALTAQANAALRGLLDTNSSFAPMPNSVKALAEYGPILRRHRILPPWTSTWNQAPRRLFGLIKIMVARN